MATPTPWQVAAAGRRPPPARRIEHYVRDPYNFSHLTVSNGTNPQLRIPPTGPNSAGAPPPTSAPTIESVEIIVYGTNPNATYGVNTGTPVSVGVSQNSGQAQPL
jgi:hypothetical protein